MPQLPLIEELTEEPVPPGSNILVEFDPASQWFNASVTITAGWLKTGGRVSYNVMGQPPDNIRSKLNRFGLPIAELEDKDMFRIVDWYTASLGRKSNEKLALDSWKFADLSIMFGRSVMTGHSFAGRQPLGPGWLRMADNLSTVARFNDEKAWVELMLSRILPSGPSTGSTQIIPLVNGLHSDWAYKAVEAAVDGIVDFRLEELEGRRRSLIGIRSMLNVGFDSRWRPLKINENLEVTLEK